MPAGLIPPASGFLDPAQGGRAASKLSSRMFADVSDAALEAGVRVFRIVQNFARDASVAGAAGVEALHEGAAE